MTLKIFFSFVVLVCLVKIIECRLSAGSTDLLKAIPSDSTKTSDSADCTKCASGSSSKEGSETGDKGDSGSDGSGHPKKGSEGGKETGDKGGTETDSKGDSDKGNPIKEIQSKLDAFFKKFFSSFASAG
ncbi:jg12376 [Pararge aegeria aegeria]|uniref:Jg12376 protein n=1 Tax=Pararge aegeria aegeria TaxID=348720 RepID=A0A8S4SEA3_9NEOP|nr:jg12376 [Pararge aegeria aegeria]